MALDQQAASLRRRRTPGTTPNPPASGVAEIK
jgi:hypothetical protein